MAPVAPPCGYAPDVDNKEASSSKNAAPNLCTTRMVSPKENEYGSAPHTCGCPYSSASHLGTKADPGQHAIFGEQFPTIEPTDSLSRCLAMKQSDFYGANYLSHATLT